MIYGARTIGQAPSLIPAGAQINVTPQSNPQWCGREVCGPQPQTAPKPVKVVRLNFAQPVRPAPPPPVRPAPPPSPAPTPPKVVALHFATGGGTGVTARPTPDAEPPPMATPSTAVTPTTDCPSGLTWGGVAAAAGGSFVLGLIIGFASGRMPKSKKKRLY